MKQTLWVKLFYGTVLTVFIFTANASAQNVEGYEKLIPLLVRGAPRLIDQYYIEIIESAKSNAMKEIVRRTGQAASIQQVRSYSKKIKSGNALQLFDLNDKYAAVAFEATSYVKGFPEKIIFSLLFERYKKNMIKYTDTYLYWVGNKRIEEFSSITEKQLCNKYYDLTGKDICMIYDHKKEELKKTIAWDMKLSSKAGVGHRHNGADIQSGIIKSEYIDQKITRDRELSSALLSFFRTNNERYVDIEYVKKLENRLKELEKTVQEMSKTINISIGSIQMISEIEKTVNRLEIIVQEKLKSESN